MLERGLTSKLSFKIVSILEKIHSSVGLRNRLNKNFRYDIPLIKFMDGSSLVELVEQLAGENENNNFEIVEGII